MKTETGRYLITARIDCGAARRFPSLFLRDEYEGWLSFHCTFDRGALSLHLRPEGRQWVCQNPRWQISEVKMLTREQYLKELEALRVPAKESKQPGRSKGHSRAR
jgi:hypothetical protein